VPRHFLEISDMSRDDIDELLAMADDGPRPEGLAGATFLSAFFQESTRTRLGFMGAAARQGAAVLDMGDADRLRQEPPSDERVVLAEVADLIAVRHWDPTFARELASTNRCAVVNAGAGSKSHPTQALIDAYTLMKALGGDIAGLTILFLGDALLRSQESFRELTTHLGIVVSHCPVSTEDESERYPSVEDRILAADVVYIQSLSSTDYGSPHLNLYPHGPALPTRVADSIARSHALIMHALPRGPELPDSLLHDPRCLVTKQIECGLPVRSAVLRWLLAAA
jgi:aspartate carbamoyltransferase catalytic subunit